MIETIYSILQVQRVSTVPEIKLQYSQLARLAHPDKESGDHETMARINRAYEIVLDDGARAAYDKRLGLLANPCVVCKTTGRVHKQRGFHKRESSGCLRCGGAGYIEWRGKPLSPWLNDSAT